MDYLIENDSILNNILYHLAVSTVANDHETGEEIAIVVNTDASTGNKPITFWRAWFLPGVFMVTKENFLVC